MKLSKFTQALRNLWNRLFNPPLTKQDFIDLGFTVDDDFTTDKWWSFFKDVDYVDLDNVTHNLTKRVNYSKDDKSLFIGYVGKEFGSKIIVSRIKINYKEELHWLFDKLKGSFLENL